MPTQPQQHSKTDDVPIQIGDALDFVTVREVASERYRRNQQYMTEILSPYAVSEFSYHDPCPSGLAAGL